MLVLHQLSVLLLEVFNVVVIAKGLRGHKVYVLLRSPKTTDQSVTEVGVTDGEDRIGDEATREADCEERVRVIEEKSYAEGDVQSYGEEVLGEHFEVLLEGALGFVEVEQDVPLGTSEVELGTEAQHVLVGFCCCLHQSCIDQFQGVNVPHLLKED
mgnify:CR=1 FL=1